MDAPLGPAILDPVPAEAVEQPAFAGGHVHGLVAAGEEHLGIGDHRDVDPRMGPPVIVRVDMERDLGARPEPIRRLRDQTPSSAAITSRI